LHFTEPSLPGEEHWRSGSSGSTSCCTGKDGLRATGGNVMGHATTYRILLRKAGKARIAIMIDSPYHMYDQTRFSITEAGIQDVEEYRNETQNETHNGICYIFYLKLVYH
jgi:hypothetical protein